MRSAGGQGERVQGERVQGERVQGERVQEPALAAHPAAQDNTSKSILWVHQAGISPPGTQQT
jgi:hypothetical protein